MTSRLPGTPDDGRRVGVYVHFPWCERKCGYCDFASEPLPPAEIPHRAYADAILNELRARVSSLTEVPSPRPDAAPPARPPSVASVYFGGGTPSLWEPRELGRVLSGIDQALSLEPGAEITVECNPNSLDRARAVALRTLGVNRISLGVQGLSRQRLTFLERLHGPTEALAALDAVVEVGFPLIAADLIFGLPGQSATAAAREAMRLTERPVSHVSAYSLTIEPDTPFGRRARAGKLPQPVEAEVAASFLAVSDALRRSGFDHYEISNYGRHGHLARHNLAIWRGGDYLGLGCGAWGTLSIGGGRERYRNTPAPKRYLEAWSRPPRIRPDASDDAAAAGGGIPPQAVAEREPIDAITALRERMILGLRLAEGVDLDAVGAELGLDPWTRVRRAAAERLARRGRLQISDGRLAIPRPAWLFADGTIAALL